MLDVRERQVDVGTWWPTLSTLQHARAEVDGVNVHAIGIQRQVATRAHANLEYMGSLNLGDQSAAIPIHRHDLHRPRHEVVPASRSIVPLANEGGLGLSSLALAASHARVGSKTDAIPA